LKPLVTIRVTDKTEHARRRRSWTRGFTTAALKGYEPFVISRSLQLIDTLASKNLKETQDLTEWCAYFAYDVMMDLACVIGYPTQVIPHLIICLFYSFGGGTELMRDGDSDGLKHVGKRTKVTVLKLVDFFQHLIYFYSRDVIFTSHVPWLGPIFFAVPGFTNNFKAYRVRAQHWARRRIKEGSTQKDLFYHLVHLHPSIFSVINDFYKYICRWTKIILLLPNQLSPRLLSTVCEI
jgi:hypothetical protein